MVFNSIPFIVFLPIVFILYWLIGTQRKNAQNRFLLLASLFFYAWWDVRFLGLILFSSGIGYVFAFWIAKAQKQRRLLLFVGLVLSLSFLLFFKYYNFFLTSFADAYSLFGERIEVQTLKLILPIGISFYTFKIVGYLLDVYYEKIQPTQSIENFVLFTTFFPQLSAGPIESSNTLMPQIEQERSFRYEQTTEGLKFFLWGLFKKVVIADSCAMYANDIFGSYSYFPASTLILGALYFAIQVYADFSGYSEMAQGIGKMFGFELMQNFNLPFLSKNVTEFWRRWHISLTQWFNDYFFGPIYIAVRDWGKLGMYLAIFCTFLLSGLWHGANWNYILYGVFQGSIIVIEAALAKRRKKWNKGPYARSYKILSNWLTMLFVLATFVIFRSPTVVEGFDYLGHIFDSSILSYPGKLAYLPMVAGLLLFEWIQRNKKYALEFNWPLVPRFGLYLILTFLILFYYGQEQEFFYFQF